jgi:predicted NACHT family NTPase
MDRGIQATAAGITKFRSALKSKGWTQEYLAGVAGCTRQTISKFLSGKRVEKRISQDICDALDLKWGEIVQLEADESDRPLNIDELVEAVRVNIYDSIQTKCGTMRVLDMTQPIDLNAIYTNVNILEKITGRQRLGIQELLQSRSLENYERFSLSGVQSPRIPALEAIDKYTKLMILGKPGSGKTTFLKYVALKYIEGMSKARLIPFFITLKDFAETDNQPSLLEYIIQSFNRYGIEPATNIQIGLHNSILHKNITPIEFLLREGRFCILLDGLDEVKESDIYRILQQIKDFSNLFAKNIFAITCRVAAREYTFEKFTEVEVADFDYGQIVTFTQQWFQAKNDPIKAKSFIEKLNQEPGIQDLASSPLLLTLLCLVFGESCNFPVNRSELYKEGLDVLLKKWDAKRNIERDRTYQKLSLKRKEDLLSQIALDTFKKGNYFFKQEEAKYYITQYIRNLADKNTDEDALQLASEEVLKSIEAQHGLFVERARGIYSFSHLTFHEYFTARKIVTIANSDILIQKLSTYITDKRWREVFLLTCGMLENVDILLRAMKQEIDIIISQDDKLQQFLVWVEKKSCFKRSKYKPTAVRAYYFDIARSRALDLPLALDFNLASALALAHDLALDLPMALPRALPLAPHLALPLARALTHALDLPLDLAFPRVIHLVRTLDLPLNPEPSRARSLALDLARVLALDLALDPPSTDAVEYIELDKPLQQIRNQLPNPSLESLKNFYYWWQISGQAWTEQLRSIAIEHYNIGHDWQFSEAQKTLLQKYYDANQLLVDCLNSDCYVSREVREEIESTLFLPIASIHKRKSR